MRLLYFFTFFALLCNNPLSAQPKEAPFTRSSFNRVVLLYNKYPSPVGGLPRPNPIGRIFSSAFLNAPNDSSRATLTPAEANEIFRRLVSPRSYTPGASLCFLPRLQLYFLQNDTLVNRVAICLECSRLKSEVFIEAAQWSEDALNPKGLNNQMRRYLSALANKYGFGNGPESAAVPDKK